MPPGFAYSIRHCVAQSEAGPIYKLIFNKCLDSKVDVQRHAPGIAFGESRISFRKFRFLGVPGGWEQNIRYACKVNICPYYTDTFHYLLMPAKLAFWNLNSVFAQSMSRIFLTNVLHL